MPHIFALLIAWITTPSFWFLPVSIFVLWTWFAHVHAGERTSPAALGFLAKPYDWCLRRIRYHVPKALCPPTVEQVPRPNGIMSGLEWLVTRRSADRRHQNQLVQNPWSWPVLDLTIRVALVYPMFFALVSWALQLPSDLGGMQLLPSEAPVWLRWATVLFVFSFVTIRALATINGESAIDKLDTWLSNFGFVFAVLFAVISFVTGIGANAAVAVATVAGTVVIASAVAGGTVAGVALAIALSLAVIGTGGLENQNGATIAAAVVVAIVGSLTVPATILWVASRPVKIGNSRRDFGIAAYLVMIAAAIYATLYAMRFNNAGNAVFVVFFVLLPLTNAIFDWFSYGATLRLLNTGWHRRNKAWFWPVITGIADIVIALALFFGLSLALVTVLHLANEYSGRHLFDLAALLSQIEEDHWQVFWVIAMIGSTLLPTFLHLTIASFSLLTVAPIGRWQTYIEKSDETRFKAAAIRARILFPLEATVLTVLPLLVVAASVWAVWEYGGNLIDLYAQTLRRIADGLGLLNQLPITVDL